MASCWTRIITIRASSGRRRTWWRYAPCEIRAGGFVCPHLWATALLADRSGAFRPLEEAHTHPVFSRGAGDSQTRRSPNNWPARAGWKIHLASMSQVGALRAGEPTTHAAGLPRQAVFVVDAQETRASHLPQVSGPARPAVIVELQSRHQKKSKLRHAGSGWTKPAAFRLEADEIETFTLAEDRDILSRIVGARPDDPMPAAGTAGAIPNSSWQAPKTCELRGVMGIDLLRRMCDTGHCRLRLPAGAIPVAAASAAEGEPAVRAYGEQFVPLRWDAGTPYEFLVRIAPHDDGKHYTLTGHLRRQGQTLPVAVANLLAQPATASQSEPGGVVFIEDRVARADLSGGLHWIDLFATRGPLHVPIADMPEFLRQVASLPAIPHFDLPEGLAFEQTTGTPRPRLIVRRPSRTGGGGGEGAGGGQPASRLDERILSTVLFDYDAGRSTPWPPPPAHTTRRKARWSCATAPPRHGPWPRSKPWASGGKPIRCRAKPTTSFRRGCCPRWCPR